LNKRAIVQQLQVMRSQLATLDAQIESVLFSLDEYEEEKSFECDHPEDRRLNLTTMGGPERWECKDCGYVYDESEVEEEN
jgi:hypothetical protein